MKKKIASNNGLNESSVKIVERESVKQLQVGNIAKLAQRKAKHGSGHASRLHGT